MFLNRAAFAALAVACLAAAGAGGYFASRQNVVPAPASAMTGTTAAPVVPTAPAVHPAAQSPAVATSKRSETARAAEAPSRRAAGANAHQAPPVPDRPSTSSTPSQAPPPPPAPSQATPDNSTTGARIDEHVAQEPPVAPGPPQKSFEEVVVSANSVIGLQTERRISSETARVEDRVEARVTRDVRVADKIAVPAGSRAIGSVILVERGGKFRERARIGIRFTTLLLADGARLPMSTETISREGEDPGNGNAAKIGGGAIAGTILGAILGGSKGAAIGAAAGAGGGAMAVEAGERNAVTLPAGSPLTVRLLAPLTVTIEEK